MVLSGRILSNEQGSHGWGIILKNTLLSEGVEIKVVTYCVAKIIFGIYICENSALCIQETKMNGRCLNTGSIAILTHSKSINIAIPVQRGAVAA